MLKRQQYFCSKLLHWKQLEGFQRPSVPFCGAGFRLCKLFAILPLIVFRNGFGQRNADIVEAAIGAFGCQDELVGEASGVSTNSGSLVNQELHSDETSSQPALDASNEASQNLECESWLDKLHKELENQGISLPERINYEYLHRFYTAAKGDFGVLLSSIKRTIRWRETYRLLSQEEL